MNELKCGVVGSEKLYTCNIRGMLMIGESDGIVMVIVVEIFPYGKAKASLK